MENKKISNKYFFISLLIGLIIFFVIGYIYSFINDSGIKKNSKYTIAYITTDWHYKNGNGVGTDYLYYVGKLEFSGTSVYNLKKGSKYLLMYDSLKENKSLLLGHHQLPNNTIRPRKGWNFKEIPVSIDSVELKKYFDDLKIK